MNRRSQYRWTARGTSLYLHKEVRLIRLDTGTYFSLNKVGTEFWEMLEGSQTIEEQAASLAAKYNVDLEIVRADLLELATALFEEKLVDIA